MKKLKIHIILLSLVLLFFIFVYSCGKYLCSYSFISKHTNLTESSAVIALQNYYANTNRLFEYISDKVAAVCKKVTKPIIDYIQRPGTYIPSETDISNIKYVFEGAKLVDNFYDHNQMIDVLRYANNKGLNIKDIPILINCDTHSDVYLNSVPTKSVADWVNTVLNEYPNITDFYWVVSGNMVKDFKYGRILSGKKKEDATKANPFFQNIDVVADLKKEESVQSYYMMPNGKLLYAKDDAEAKSYIQKNYRKIRLHICTEKNLPDFKNKKVITTFDMDYFSNSGNDTINNYADNKTAKKLNKAFSQILSTFAEHNIQPVIHGNCYSSDKYLPKEDLKQAMEFANTIISNILQGTDIISEYKYSNK